MKGQFELFLSSTVSDTACLFALDFLTLTTATPIRGYGSAVLIYKVEERKEGPGFHTSLSLCVCVEIAPEVHLLLCSRNPVAAEMTGC